MGYNPVPVQPAVLCRYIVFLARSLKYSSIRQYLNIISILHKEYGYSFKLSGNWIVDSLLKGIKREKGNTVTKKLPVTPEILLQIRSQLDLQTPDEANFWAACLVAFFGLLRKANLLPVSTRINKDPRHLCRSDFTLQSWGLAVKLTHSKTNQFKDRVVMFALPTIPKHPLCPVTAVLHAFALSSTAPFTGPAFVSQTREGFQPLTARTFSSLLSANLQRLGFSATNYSGHSFRRGGASWALACGIPAEVIQILGDWKSACFMEYLHCPLSTRLNYIQQFALSLPH